MTFAVTSKGFPIVDVFEVASDGNASSFISSFSTCVLPCLGLVLLHRLSP